MAQLNTRTAKVNAIISLKHFTLILLNDLKDRLKNYLESNCHDYAFIVHDKDILENGEVKTMHIHIVANFTSNRKRLITLLGEIANVCEIDTLAVSIDKYTDYVGSMQYLIHKNNSEKYQYPLADIVTNITKGELTTIMNSDSVSISIEYFIDIIKNANTKIDVMRKLGLGYYHLYRNTINDIWRELKESA